MRTGVIGLGAMGAGMALNLHKAGQLSAVWNRTRSKVDGIAAETGALGADSPADVARHAEVVITCVSRDEDLKEVIDAMLEGVSPETIVVDTSTVSAGTARAIAGTLSGRGAGFLDCPVSGGVEGARKGTLAMMVGGEARVLERARPALESIAGNIVHMGPTGSGQATKAVNQIMCAGINEAVTEALAFGETMGLDMNKVIEVVGSGAAGNWFLTHRGKTMVAGAFEPGFRVRLHHKDLSICRDMAGQEESLALPLTDMTLHDYERLMDAGHGDEDISSLYRLKRPPERAGS